jgi:hypothetical protein
MNSYQPCLRVAILGSLIVPLALATSACVSGKKAFPIAAQHSGCKSDRIEVVRQDGHDLVLNVCGTHEDWHWHPLNGWEYVGRAAEQPTPPPPPMPVDRDVDGVPDTLDACPDAAGVVNVDPKLNGCPAPVSISRGGWSTSMHWCSRA